MANRAARWADIPPSRFVTPRELYALSGTNGTGAGGTWPTASLAIFTPFSEAVDVVVSSVIVNCTAGTSAGRNWDVGFFGETGTTIKTMGQTLVVAGLNTWTPSGGLPLQGGVRYYLGMSANNTTLAFWRNGTGALNLRQLGYAQQASATPLSTSAVTLAQIGSSYQPFIVVNFAAAP